MKRLLLSVIGEPGVGKSTAVRLMWAALGVERSELGHDGVPHMLRFDGSDRLIGAEVGLDRHPFGGTDALSMSVMPQALEWIQRQRDVPLIVAEGDRLASPRFYGASRRANRQVLIVWINGPTQAAARRIIRHPTQQNDSWVKGRQTKVERLARAQGAIELPAERTPTRLGYDLAQMTMATLAS